MINKSIYPILIFFIAASLLAACAGAPTPAVPTQEPVTVKFVYMRYSGDYEALAEEYQKLHPNVTIELKAAPVVIPGSARNLDAEVNEQDAVRFPITGVESDLMEKFLPLDSLISASKEFPFEDLVPGSLDAFKLNGKQVAIPAGINPLLVFYSPKKFKSLGAEPPRPDWTIEEFNQLAKSLHNMNENEIGSPKYTAGFCSSPYFLDILNFSYLFGGGWFDNLASPTKATLNRPENIEAVNWFAGLRTELGVIPEKYQGQDIFPLMNESDCGLWTDTIDRVLWISYGPGDATPLPLPQVEESAGAKSGKNFVFMDGYSILADSPHPEAAFAWIRFLMEHDAASGRQVPPLKSSIESSSYAARVSKSTLAVAKSLEAGIMPFNLELLGDDRFDEIFTIYSDAIIRVMEAEADARQALEEAQLKADQVYK